MDQITCIYCKKIRPRPARGEHVMLEALGGTITIPDVCGGKSGCNQMFGDSIDRELLRNSPVTLHRLVLSKGQTHEQQMFYFRHDHGVWLDVIIRVKERWVVLPPQLYLHGDRPIIVASAEFESERMDLVRQPVEVLAQAKKLINAWDQSTPRIVYLPALGRYVARARSDAEYDAFFSVLREKLADLSARAAGGASEQVSLSLQENRLVLPLAAAINDSPRCAAKMAFNFLSLYLGPEVALRPEFDSVRAYITGERVDPIRAVEAENGEAGVTVDTRHVANWFTTNLTANHWNLLRDAHYITLLAQNRVIGAEVGLFGGRSRFLITFGTVGADLVVTSPLPAVLLTNIGGGGDRMLADEELVDAPLESGRYDGLKLPTSLGAARRPPGLPEPRESNGSSTPSTKGDQRCPHWKG